MTQTPNEELSKLVKCVERANPKLGYVVKLLVEELLGHSSNQPHTNLRGSATCLLHGATGLY